jgi:hypothetical protein
MIATPERHIIAVQMNPKNYSSIFFAYFYVPFVYIEILCVL